MKKKLILIGFLGFTALFGCSQVSQEVEAGKDSDVVKASSDRIDWVDYTIIKHKETGCHFMFADGDQESGFVQMFIEKNGVSVPYCEK